jgi:hypothetical protein
MLHRNLDVVPMLCYYQILRVMSVLVKMVMVPKVVFILHVVLSARCHNRVRSNGPSLPKDPTSTNFHPGPQNLQVTD